jgi:hypothetical protein
LSPRAVLDEIVSDAEANEDASVDVLLARALSVKRRRMQNVGEVVELIYVVPPDPTTPED